MFAIDCGIAKRWWVKPFLKIIRAMPLDPTKPMATRALIHAVRKGETLIIFPEGRLTVTGSLMKVYDGAGMIAEKSGRRSCRCASMGLEATIFSRLSENQVPRRWFPKVKVDHPGAGRTEGRRTTCAARPAGRRRALALYRDHVRPVLSSTTDARPDHLHRRRRSGAQKHGLGRASRSKTRRRRPIVLQQAADRGADPRRKASRSLAPPASPIGLMLPNINAAGAAFLGLISANRPPAMINFSAGPANILSACARRRSRPSSRRGPSSKRPSCRMWSSARSGNRLRSISKTCAATFPSLDKLRAFFVRGTAISPPPDDRAVILFTSGSEGAPKGVVLSHRNILSNVAQAASRIDFGRRDRLFNVLPIFHSSA